MRGKVLNELAGSLLYALQHFGRQRVIAQAAIAVLAAIVLLLTGLVCGDEVYQKFVHHYTLLGEELHRCSCILQARSWHSCTPQTMHRQA